METDFAPRPSLFRSASHINISGERGSHDASSPTRRARPWPLPGARTKPESELQHRDANGPALAYVLYFEDETGRLMATHRLTRDEAIPSTSPKCAAQKPLK